MGEYPAVTLSLAKCQGKNAVTVANAVLKNVHLLKGLLIPAGVEMTVTRNYGETAQEKSNELLKHLLLATLSVTALIGLALGWRSPMAGWRRLLLWGVCDLQKGVGRDGNFSQPSCKLGLRGLPTLASRTRRLRTTKSAPARHNTLACL